jgi:hypothetical protein
MNSSTTALLVLMTIGPASLSQFIPAPSDPHYRAGETLATDDFRHGLAAWHVEMERPGVVTAKDGTLDIDVPAGVTVWFNRELSGPLMITYEATMISADGPKDRVSDLNSFWMATDPRSRDDIFAKSREGALAAYNDLWLYYVGLGGNGNTTTRFRRYIGDAVDRPLFPKDDFSVKLHPEFGLSPNRTQRVTLIADGHLIQYWRDGEKIFETEDPQPYTKGWFGIRTTKNHMQVRNVIVERLIDR